VRVTLCDTEPSVGALGWVGLDWIGLDWMVRGREGGRRRRRRRRRYGSGSGSGSASASSSASVVNSRKYAIISIRAVREALCLLLEREGAKAVG